MEISLCNIDVTIILYWQDNKNVFSQDSSNELINPFPIDINNTFGSVYYLFYFYISIKIGIIKENIAY